MENGYSIDNAHRFAWSSVTGDLNAERVSHLNKYLVGRKILDAGCSGGAYVDHLTRQGLQVTGVEKYGQFINLAREQLREGAFVEGDITCLPFRNKVFDSTYCYDVLEHVDDRVALAELARVTSRRLIVAVPQQDDVMSRFNLTFLHYSDKTHLRNYTENSLKELLTQIPSANVLIFQELPVPLDYLVRNLIKFNVEEIAPVELRYRFLKMMIRELLRFRRPSFKLIYQQTYNRLLQRIYDHAQYAEISVGLVAVVDLDRDHQL